MESATSRGQRNNAVFKVLATYEGDCKNYNCKIKFLSSLIILNYVKTRRRCWWIAADSQRLKQHIRRKNEGGRSKKEERELRM